VFHPLYSVLRFAVVCQSALKIVPIKKTRCLFVGNNEGIIAYRKAFVNIIGLILNVVIRCIMAVRRKGRICSRKNEGN